MFSAEGAAADQPEDRQISSQRYKAVSKRKASPMSFALQEFFSKSELFRQFCGLIKSAWTTAGYWSGLKTMAQF